ncbi:hypothetical protein QBC46DRAFT_418992 [Diplogelasinospora grovesii]|uniref:F-box domain-containing protein n=1 Tax=Diplogelasinospora grovesii TaxID=303347 RepID=A0AAN6NE07_9PEZI|nr:hypothetical protein QBC46DRAFT_418992 [Diplogelasinospora grovesii]
MPLLRLRSLGKATNRDVDRLILRLLEKDLSDQFYLSPVESPLVRFSPSWGPLTPAWARLTKNGKLTTDNTIPASFFLGDITDHDADTDRKYCLRYCDARLVMSRHLYGSPRGLPLSNLDACIDVPGSDPQGQWTQCWTAKIIDGELLLCAIHRLSRPSSSTIAFPDGSVFILGAGERHGGKYRICQHNSAPRWAVTPPTRPSPPDGRHRKNRAKQISFRDLLLREKQEADAGMTIITGAESASYNGPRSMTTEQKETG